MKRLLTFLLCIFVCFTSRAQLSTNEEPISFKRYVEIDTNRQIDIKTMPSLDMEAKITGKITGTVPLIIFSVKVLVN